MLWMEKRSIFKINLSFKLPRSPVSRIEIFTASMEFLVIYSDCFVGCIMRDVKFVRSLGQLKEIVVTPSDVRFFFLCK